MTSLATLFRMTLTAAALPLALAACGGGDAGSAPTPPPPPPPPAPAPDTTPPTLAITGTSSTVTSTPVTLTFTFSEDVGSSFIDADVAVTNGTAGSLTKVDATHYTLTVTPPAGSSGTMTVAVAASAFSDLASNANTGASSVTQDYNTTTPVVEYAVVDFTSASLKQTDFGGSASSFPPADTPPAGGPSTPVVEIKKTAGAQIWAGTTLSVGALDSVGTMPFTSTHTKLTVVVYSPAAGVSFKLKAEDANDGTHSVESDQIAVAGWQTLTFDMAHESSGTAALNLAYTFNKISVFPNFGVTPGADQIYYVGDIEFLDANAASAPPLGSGGGGGGGGGTVTLTGGVFASNYAQVDGVTWTSTQGGTAGRYIDTGVVTQDWWNGVAPGDATPSFYFGYGINSAAKPWGFGAYVSTPTNGTVDVSGYTSLHLAAWGNDELMTTHPTVTVLMKGPDVAGCSAVLKSSYAVTGIGVQTYTLPLSAFTLDTACTYANAAAAMAAGIAQIHLQVLGTNVQYVTPADGLGNYANGLNIGPITFN